jgi:NDP-sugar pyrophosphorylase family protein
MREGEKGRVTSMLHPADFFDLDDKAVAELFSGCEHVWEVLPRLKEHTERLVGEGQTLLGEVMAGAHLSDGPIYVGQGARIEPGAYIKGPAYIGPDAEVRHGAYIRENVILMAGSTLGHASEAKNSLFLPGSAAPHFAYVGDSVLGRRVNLGAGTKLSNVTLVGVKDPSSGKRPTLRITVDGVEYDTGLSKFGAILGDDVQTGCNAVLNPGCLIGPRSLVYANLSLRKGYYPADGLIKLRQEIIQAAWTH